MFGRRKRQSSNLSNEIVSAEHESSAVIGNNQVKLTATPTGEKKPVFKRLFSFSTGHSKKAEIVNMEKNNTLDGNHNRRHTVSTGGVSNEISWQAGNGIGTRSTSSTPIGRYAFDFPSPENVGHVRRARNHSISSSIGAASITDHTLKINAHKITPNLSEKDLLKAMPPLIRAVYENKSDQFHQELKTALKFSAKKQIPGIFDILDKHHKRNIFHWIVVLNRQNIAKIAIDIINNRQIVDYLLSAVDRDGRTPLHLAAIHQHTLMVRICLNLCFLSGNSTDKLGMTALAYAVECGGDISVCSALLAKGLDPNCRDSGGVPIIFKAIALRNEAVSIALINGGADVNLRNPEGKTPLHLAVSMQSKVLIQTLLNHNPDLESRDLNGDTAINIAIRIHEEQLKKTGGLPERVWNPKGLPIISREILDFLQEKLNNNAVGIDNLELEPAASLRISSYERCSPLQSIAENEVIEPGKANSLKSSLASSRKSVSGDRQVAHEDSTSNKNEIAPKEGLTDVTRLATGLPTEDCSSKIDGRMVASPDEKQNHSQVARNSEKKDPPKTINSTEETKPADMEDSSSIKPNYTAGEHFRDISDLDITSSRNKSGIEPAKSESDSSGLKETQYSVDKNPRDLEEISRQDIKASSDSLFPSHQSLDRVSKTRYSSHSDIGQEIELIRRRLAEEIASRKFFEKALENSNGIIKRQQNDMQRTIDHSNEMECINLRIKEENLKLETQLMSLKERSLSEANDKSVSADLVPAMERRIAELERERSVVLESLEAETSSRANLEKDVKQMRAEWKILEHKLSTERDINAALKRELNSLREGENENDYIQLLRDQLNEEIELRKQLEEENDRSNVILSEMEHDVAEIRLLYEEEVKNNEKLRSQRENLENNFDAVSAVATALNSKLSEHQQTIDRQIVFINEMNSDKARIIQQKMSLEESLNEMKAALTALKTEYAADKMAAEKDRLAAEKFGLAASQNAAKIDHAEKITAEKTQLMEENKDLQRALSDARFALEAAQNDQSAKILEATVNAVKIELAEKTHLIQKNKDLEVALQEARDLLEMAKRELVAERQNFAKVSLSVIGAEKNMGTSQQAAQNLNQYIAEVDNKTYDKEQQRLIGETNANQEKIEELQHLIMQSEQSIISLQTAKDSMEKILNRATLENAKLLEDLQVAHNSNEDLEKRILLIQAELNSQKASADRGHRQTEIEVFQQQRKINEENAKLTEDLMRVNLEAIDLKARLGEMRTKQEEAAVIHSQRLIEIEAEWNAKLSKQHSVNKDLSVDYEELKKLLVNLERDFKNTKESRDLLENFLMDLWKATVFGMDKELQKQFASTVATSDISPREAISQISEAYKFLTRICVDRSSEISSLKIKNEQLSRESSDLLRVTAELKANLSSCQIRERELHRELELKIIAQKEKEENLDGFISAIGPFIQLLAGRSLKASKKETVAAISLEENPFKIIEHLCVYIDDYALNLPSAHNEWLDFSNGNLNCEASTSRRMKEIIGRILHTVDASLFRPTQDILRTCTRIMSMASNDMFLQQKKLIAETNETKNDLRAALQNNEKLKDTISSLEKKITSLKLSAKSSEEKLLHENRELSYEIGKLRRNLYNTEGEMNSFKDVISTVSRTLIKLDKLILLFECSRDDLIKQTKTGLNQDAYYFLKSTFQKISESALHISQENSINLADNFRLQENANHLLLKIMRFVDSDRECFYQFCDSFMSREEQFRIEIDKLKHMLGRNSIDMRQVDEMTRENVAASAAFRAFLENSHLVSQERRTLDEYYLKLMQRSEKTYNRNFDELYVDFTATRMFLVKTLQRNSKLESDIKLACHELERTHKIRNDMDKQIAELRVIVKARRKGT